MSRHVYHIASWSQLAIRIDVLLVHLVRLLLGLPEVLLADAEILEEVGGLDGTRRPVMPHVKMLLALSRILFQRFVGKHLRFFLVLIFIIFVLNVLVRQEVFQVLSK